MQRNQNSTYNIYAYKCFMHYVGILENACQKKTNKGNLKVYVMHIQKLDTHRQTQ